MARLTFPAWKNYNLFDSTDEVLITESDLLPEEESSSSGIADSDLSNYDVVSLIEDYIDEVTGDLNGTIATFENDISASELSGQIDNQSDQIEKIDSKLNTLLTAESETSAEYESILLDINENLNLNNQIGSYLIGFLGAVAGLIMVIILTSRWGSK